MGQYGKLDSEFNRNVLKLFSGTMVAQVIALGIMPLLTRLYTPEDFSKLALYNSVVAILVVIATLKYDKAIILSSNSLEARGLVTISFVSTIVYTIVLFVIFSLFGNNILISLGINLSTIEIWLIPMSVIVISFVNIFNQIANNDKQYSEMSVNKVSISATSSFIKLIAPFTLIVPSLGLILSEFVGQLVGLFQYYRRLIFMKSYSVSNDSMKSLKSLLYKYRSLPIYSLPSDFLAIISKELPILLFASFYGPAYVGLYMLSKRVLEAPISLLSTAILDVFKKQATEDYLLYGRCDDIFIKTIVKLLGISFFPTAIIFLSASSLFELVFGEEWKLAGEMARLLSIVYFFKFISSPLTYVLYITNKLWLDLILQIIILLFSFVSIWYGKVYYDDIFVSLKLYILLYSVVYIIYLGISFYYSRGVNESNI